MEHNTVLLFLGSVHIIKPNRMVGHDSWPNWPMPATMTLNQNANVAPGSVTPTLADMGVGEGLWSITHRDSTFLM
jgi:hypothetical protein